MLSLIYYSRRTRNRNLYKTGTSGSPQAVHPELVSGGSTISWGWGGGGGGQNKGSKEKQGPTQGQIRGGGAGGGYPLSLRWPAAF